jgi:hypothetical protein
MGDLLSLRLDAPHSMSIARLGLVGTFSSRLGKMGQTDICVSQKVLYHTGMGEQDRLRLAGDGCLTIRTADPSACTTALAGSYRIHPANLSTASATVSPSFSVE